MKLVVGLGNIGNEYLNTRHNIGFSIIDRYLENTKWSKSLYGLYYKSNNVIYLKPNTYMNLSGNAVKYFVDYYKISISDLLIIHDDLDIIFGSFKLKKDSSSGGHNGIKSIIESLSSNSFLRLKIGIKNSEIVPNAVNFVLGKFTKRELQKCEENQKIYDDVITDFISELTAEELMNKYN